jgi:hypothetical protein
MSERGFAALEFVLGIACIVLPLTLLAMSLPTWFERQSTARAIAREVARTQAIELACVPEAGSRLGAEMSRNLGLSPADVEVTIDCPPGISLMGAHQVTAAVRVRIPALVVPFLGGIGGFSWTARHTEPIDQYAGEP